MSKIKVQAPASKSLSHRNLICAALAPGQSNVQGLLQSEDLERTQDCLAAFGAQFDQAPIGLQVTGINSKPQAPAILNVGESGTTCRLMTAVGAGLGDYSLSGTGRMHDRPIGDLAKALQTWGAEFTYQEKENYPPFSVKCPELSGGTTIISLEESSQYLSGLLLAAPLAKSEVEIHIGGSKVVSWPYVALTLQVMSEFGVQVEVVLWQDGQWRTVSYKEIREVTPDMVRFKVKPQPYLPGIYQVEGDWSNASYFLAAGVVGNLPVQIKGLRPDSLQGDRSIVDILRLMGADIKFDSGEIIASPSKLNGVDVDMGHCPDLVPTVATVASFAQGKTRVRNVAHLRIKESDRLAAIESELSKVGIGVTLFNDGLEITPTQTKLPRDAELSSHDDHRIAMSMSLLEFAGVRVELDNPGCVAKSFPGFWQQWAKVRLGRG